jgi:hypothetical protein
LIFSLKLIAGFQSHCNRYVGNIGELLEQFVTVDLATDETVLIALAEFLAHLGKWIGLFEISIAIESVLHLVNKHVGERVEVGKFMQEVRTTCRSCPKRLTKRSTLRFVFRRRFAPRYLSNKVQACTRTSETTPTHNS